MFRKVLIANRGEIALRITRSLQRLGIRAVAVYADADRYTAPVLAADEAYRLGPAPARESYLNVDAVLAACQASGAEAVHPGYGFLSENAAFAERLEAAGIRFIGPRPEHLRAFGLKHTARALAAKAGVPLLPGSGLLADLDAALAAAAAIGYPVMLKSTAGGGGIGMQRCDDAAALRARYAAVQRMAAASFGDAGVYLERYVDRARHIEVQIFGDGRGGVIALGERDCSLQRRHQKVVEETPAAQLPAATRAQLQACAVALGRAAHYASAGTVEFIYDTARDAFYFLEVNTRLQVEHPLTECVYGIDLVEWMLRQAAGEFTLPAPETLQPRGAAIEMRVYAEDPAQNFAPRSGVLSEVHWPAHESGGGAGATAAAVVRVDTWIDRGEDIGSHYDPLLAKLIVHGADRPTALARLRQALAETRIGGIETNLDYLRSIAAWDAFADGDLDTGALARLPYAPRRIDVLQPGTRSSLQDWPGRLGYWDVGIPPSGPMDARAFRLANRLVGNAEGAVALECTLRGPSLYFRCEAIVALAGAAMQAELDGVLVPLHTPLAVAAGQTLQLGAIDGPGQRCYLAVRGGFAAPQYLGSAATFDLGGFGGHATGVLRAGDSLPLALPAPDAPAPRAAQPDEAAALSSDWHLRVRYGPHGAPDFFTAADIETLFSSAYEVHFNSARTGVRLIGAKPQWARRDGGEAGLHPSNLHDNAYAIGAIDFTGDMPIILGPDGPSLGGFVCPAVVSNADLWKLGQLSPGDRVRFVLDAPADADGDSDGDTDAATAAAFVPSRRPASDAARNPTRNPANGAAPAAILRRLDDGPVAVVYRRAGDDNLLIEYGDMVLDVALRLRVHLLAAALREQHLPGLIDLTPGVRSLQVHYDSRQLSTARLLAVLVELERGLPDAAQAEVDSRIVHLPLSWNDPAIRLAMRKYQELVRPNAPWCPDNIEFIRRINGLDAIDAVRRIVFSAEYLVLGLGDVYLGAPVATPLDPRHRLVTTKYNPARTWTPENAVGIGGAYLCVYGMEGPGGYQLFGRTLQMWNRWRRTPEFTQPWLLRNFDRIRFYPVDEQELRDARDAFPHGRYPLRIETSRFHYGDYAQWLAAHAESIAAFKRQQQAAFAAERADWQARGLDRYIAEDQVPPPDEEALPAGSLGLPSPVTGNVWKLLIEEGQRVTAGETVAILESMKMEIAVSASHSGRITALRCKPGATVRAGQILAIIGES